MKENITEQLDAFTKMCEHAYEDGCSEDVISAWDHVSAAFGRIIPGYFDCLNGPDSPWGDMRLLDLPLIAAKLRIFRAKLEYDAAEDNNGPSAETIEKTSRMERNIPFKLATDSIVDDDTFTDIEKSEIFIKINDLKSLAESHEAKSVKWDKMKPFLSWVNEKDINLASRIIPLVSEALK